MTMTKPFRARIDRNSRKVGLPVPPSGLAQFTIKGTWRDFAAEGPDPSVVVLKCRARIAKRNSEHRLTRDQTFQLPEGTEFAELQVFDPSPVLDLEVTISDAPRVSAHARPFEWSYARKAKAEETAWAA